MTLNNITNSCAREEASEVHHLLLASACLSSLVLGTYLSFNVLWHLKVRLFYCEDNTGLSKRKGAKFGEVSSVRADWLNIACLKLVGSRVEGNSNRGLFFCTSLYRLA